MTAVYKLNADLMRVRPASLYPFTACYSEIKATAETAETFDEELVDRIPGRVSESHSQTLRDYVAPDMANERDYVVEEICRLTLENTERVRLHRGGLGFESQLRSVCTEFACSLPALKVSSRCSGFLS